MDHELIVLVRFATKRITVAFIFTASPANGGFSFSRSTDTIDTYESQVGNTLVFLML